MNRVSRRQTADMLQVYVETRDLISQTRLRQPSNAPEERRKRESKTLVGGKRSVPQAPSIFQRSELGVPRELSTTCLRSAQ